MASETIVAVPRLIGTILQARAERDEAIAQASRLAARPSVVLARPWTPDVKNGTVTTFAVKRSCNSCGTLVGDVTEDEMGTSSAGLGLPDVRYECVFCLRVALDDTIGERDRARGAAVALKQENAGLRRALERLADGDDEPQDDDIDAASRGADRWGWGPIPSDPEEATQRLRDLRHEPDGGAVIALAALARTDPARSEP